MSHFDLTGRIALVTGASSGLGAHFAATLARNGCAVALAARRIDRLTALAARISGDGGEALAVPMDVGDLDSISTALDAVAAQFGTVDVLINNAGLAAIHSFLEAPAEETSEVFSINQSAVWNVAQQVCRRMVEHGKAGSVVNISSITGLRAVGGAASYAVTKAAVAHMTRVQAFELARHGIRVNAIAPGYFETEFTRKFLATDAGEKLRRRIPMQRIGHLKELDGLLLLLVSDLGSFMTGAVIPVDGGHLLAGL